jgi:hypothetical protein
MGQFIVTTNTSLDGVVQDPDGQEGFERGGWFRQFGGKDLDGWTRLETTRRWARSRGGLQAEAGDRR